jgi:hypothetical protein
MNSFRRQESVQEAVKKKTPTEWQGSLYPRPPVRARRHQERGLLQLAAGGLSERFLDGVR